MIKLWENTPGFDSSINQPEPNIIPYLVESDKPNACVIVCPGGGYGGLCSSYEGADVCEWLNTIGISAFLLTYRVKPYNHQLITNDLLRAIRLVRYKAEEFNINKNQIGVMGFSAGGHLCSSAAVHFEDAVLDENDSVDKESSRPDCALLCYPVISTRPEIANKLSFKHMLGKDMTTSLLSYYSSEYHVKENTPPVFLWHTANDEMVPSENSMDFAVALAKKKILCELHLYPDGRHGLGLADGLHPESWKSSCENFIKRVLMKETV